jgi:selenide,water dikinase
MIQTVDFFTPIVDDPFLFGQIGAANALSDIYAMGGEPKVALNIVGFPNCLDPAILGEILRGGAMKVKEADAVLVGGHSVQNDEPQYGLCVSGFVHPDHIWKNYGAKPGDALILTKPVGNGLVNTAVKASMSSEESVREATEAMVTLNRTAAEVFRRHEIHACTDITGFGLIGHCLEMAEGSRVTLQLSSSHIPCITDAEDYAKMGLIPAGTYRNRDYAEGSVRADGIDDSRMDLLYDPQTSGGLLAAVPESEAPDILRELRSRLKTKCGIIGTVLPGAGHRIIVT